MKTQEYLGPTEGEMDKWDLVITGTIYSCSRLIVWK